MVRRKVATKRRQRPPRTSLENESLADHGYAIRRLNEELNRVAGIMPAGFPTGLFNAIRDVTLSYNAALNTAESVVTKKADPEARKLIAVGAVLGAFKGRHSPDEVSNVIEELADAFGLMPVEVAPPESIPADYIDLTPPKSPPPSAVPPPPDSCPHGVDLANDECDACMRASDEAYDAARERGRL